MRLYSVSALAVNAVHAAHKVKYCGFARAAGAQNYCKLSLLHVETQSVHGAHLARAAFVYFYYVFSDNQFFRHDNPSL